MKTTPDPETTPPGILLGTGLVRPAFIHKMEAELTANAQKGDWRLWSPSKMEVWDELKHHLSKLQYALAEGTPESTSEFAADTANILMKIDECFGAQAPQPPAKKPSRARAILDLALVYLQGILQTSPGSVSLPTPGWSPENGEEPTSEEAADTFNLFFGILQHRDTLEQQIQEIENRMCGDSYESNEQDELQYKFLKQLQTLFTGAYGPGSIQSLFNPEKPTQAGKYFWMLPEAEKPGHYVLKVEITRETPETELSVFTDEGDEIVTLSEAKNGFWAKRD
jgi:hypothetical protein